MRKRLLRQSVCLHSQSRPRKLCVDDDLLDSLGWCAPFLWVPRIRVSSLRRWSRAIALLIVYEKDVGYIP